MPTAIDMLKEDHEKVRDLFEEYNSLEDDDYSKRNNLSAKIFDELEIHMDLEEEIFYPSVENAGEGEMVAESIAEHEVVKDLIDDLLDMDSNDEEYDAKMKVMQENIEHHIEEEEGKMFHFAERNLKPDLEKISNDMADLKKEIKEAME